MINKQIILSEKDLHSINLIAHSAKFKPYIKKLNSNFESFNKFIDCFEINISNKLNQHTISKNSFEEIFFESVISRLDYLNNYKKIAIRIYLESQKNNNYFLLLSKYLNKYFSKYTNNFYDKSFLLGSYFLCFQIWIEDNEDLDKSMAFLGKAIEFRSKFESFFKK